MNRILRLFAVALALGAAMPAIAAYPDKPIRLVITAPPGGTIDFLARTLGAAMSNELGQQIVVDNRGGASGLLGADLVAKAPPDGYTILLTDGASLAINAAVRKDMPFDIEKDLVPLSLVATLPTALAVNPSFPAKDLKGFVTSVKATPGKVGYATPGLGTPHHLDALILARSAQLDYVHIPYKGGGPMFTDVVGGQVPSIFSGALPMLPFANSGKLKVLAVASSKRLPQLPDVPTFAEAGYPDVDVQVFFSMWLPAKTPADVVATISRAYQKALADPEVRRKLEEQTLVVVGSSPDQLRSHFREKSTQWGSMVKAAGIVLE